MSASGFGLLDHVPHVLSAEVRGAEGAMVLCLGDDSDVARLVFISSGPCLTLDAGALRDLGVALIEAAGRIEQRSVLYDAPHG